MCESATLARHLASSESVLRFGSLINFLLEVDGHMTIVGELQLHLRAIYELKVSSRLSRNLDLCVSVCDCCAEKRSAPAVRDRSRAARAGIGASRVIR